MRKQLEELYMIPITPDGQIDYENGLSCVEQSFRVMVRSLWDTNSKGVPTKAARDAADRVQDRVFGRSRQAPPQAMGFGGVDEAIEMFQKAAAARGLPNATTPPGENLNGNGSNGVLHS